MTHTRSWCRNGLWSTTVTVVAQSRGEPGPVNFGDLYEDGSLNVVINSLTAIREGIPPEYRGVARCEISADIGYEDSSYPRVKVTYERTETADEAAAREERDRRAAALEEAKARETYAALRRRFDQR